MLVLAACTQNELGDSGGLPEGEYPLVIKAGGLEGVVSRATVDGDWDGVADMVVKVGSEVKKYNVYNNWQTATLSSTDDPFYWTSRNDIEVEAWWPYDAVNLGNIPPVVVKADQSSWENYRNSDYIYAHSNEVKFENPTLTFTHRTACITVTLVGGDGITDLSNAQVMIKGLSTQDGNPTTIRTNRYTAVPSALVAPQTIQDGTKFISVSLNGGVYNYTTGEQVVLAANQRYNYTLRVNGKKLEFVDCAITDWTDIDATIDAEKVDYIYDESTDTYTVYTVGGLYAWAYRVHSGYTNTNCILKSDITLPAADESGNNWMPIYVYYGVFDGNGHFISGLSVNVQNYAGFFASVDNTAIVKNLMLKDVNIKGEYYVGGVVGYNTGHIIACSSSGNVSGISGIGGIAGSNSSDANITACYSLTNINGENNLGGVLGENEAGFITSCYWSGNLTSGVGNGSGSATKVEGNVTWQTATNDMNEALETVNSEWIYVQGDDKNISPTLQKKP